MQYQYTCKQCNKSFESRVNQRLFCNRSCRTRYLNLHRGCYSSETFWAFVDSSGGQDSCWNWKRSTNHGYGHLAWKHEPRLVYAHRIAYELTHGDVPHGLFVLHKCDNRSCCNPRHLFLGTNADNMEDMKRKGRSVRMYGEKSGKAKLNWIQVIEIRTKYTTHKFSSRKLASLYGVAQRTIMNVIHNKCWRITDCPYQTPADFKAG